MYCMRCGQEMPDDLNYCTNCGNELSFGKAAIDASQAQARGVSQPLPSYTTQATQPRATSAQDSFGRHEQGSVLPVNPAMASGRSASPAAERGASRKSNVPVIVAAGVVLAIVLGAVLFFAVGGSSDSGNQLQTTDLESDSDAARQDDEAAEADKDEPVASGAPKFVRLSASSVLESGAESYGPEHLVDGDTRSAWSEGSAGTGEGEWVEFQADMKQNVSTITIMGGLCKTEDLYWENGRPKEITISFDDGSRTKSTLSDQPFAWHTITLEHPVQTKTVRITIDSVYGGNHYTNLCISEISIL